MLLQRWMVILFLNDPHKAGVAADCGERGTISFWAEVWKHLDKN